MIAAAGLATQAISALMSALSPSSGSSTSQAMATSGFQQAMPGCDNTQSNASAKPQMSDQMLMALVSLQTQGGAGSSGATGNDPVQQLFSAMDTDGDGEISQGEMEA